MSIKDFGYGGVRVTGQHRQDVESQTAGSRGSSFGGAALEAPDAGVYSPQSAPALQVFPWWYYPAPGSEYFYVDALPSQVVGAGVQNFPLVGSDFTCQEGAKAVMVGVALVVQSPIPANNFFYTLLLNGAPVPGLNQLRNFAVTANAAVRDLNGYAVQLEPGDTISWTVTNNGALAVTVGLSYFGWRTMVTEIQRIQQGVNY